MTNQSSVSIAQAFTAKQFAHYMPAECTGYMRLLRPDEPGYSSEKVYYGIFDADGDCLWASTEVCSLRTLTRARAFQVLSVH